MPPMASLLSSVAAYRLYAGKLTVLGIDRKAQSDDSSAGSTEYREQFDEAPHLEIETRRQTRLETRRQERVEQRLEQSRGWPWSWTPRGETLYASAPTHVGFHPSHHRITPSGKPETLV